MGGSCATSHGLLMPFCNMEILLQYCLQSSLSFRTEEYLSKKHTTFVCIPVQFMTCLVPFSVKNVPYCNSALLGLACLIFLYYRIDTLSGILMMYSIK